MACGGDFGSDSNQIPGFKSIPFEEEGNLNFSEDAISKLEDVVDFMSEHQNSFTVQIEGHTDSNDSIEYNLELGKNRAEAVFEYLVASGIPEELLDTISYGKEKPIDIKNPNKNRRVNFILIPK